jgi:hypothetical protein
MAGDARHLPFAVSIADRICRDVGQVPPGLYNLPHPSRF